MLIWKQCSMCWHHAQEFSPLPFLTCNGPTLLRPVFALSLKCPAINMVTTNATTVLIQKPWKRASIHASKLRTVLKYLLHMKLTWYTTYQKHFGQMYQILKPLSFLLCITTWVPAPCDYSAVFSLYCFWRISCTEVLPQATTSLWLASSAVHQWQWIVVHTQRDSEGMGQSEDYGKGKM